MPAGNNGEGDEQETLTIVNCGLRIADPVSTIRNQQLAIQKFVIHSPVHGGERRPQPANEGNTIHERSFVTNRGPHPHLDGGTCGQTG